MKLRYLIISLLLCFAVGCAQEELNTLSEIQLPQSYVSIDVNGGTESLSFTATENWQVVESSVPSWLTITPMSGPAGEATIAFKAGSTKATNNAEIQISCGGKTQYINVIQFAAKAEPKVSTAAEVIAGADGATYRVKGTCTSIANTSYGNFYINDGTGEVYIYGTVDATGAYNWSSFGIEVGDIVTVEGPKSTYNGTVELVDAAFISVIKSLLSVEPSDASVGKEGGEVELKVVYKGKDLKVNPQVDWISLANINVQSDTTVVTLKINENTADPRTGEVIFESSIPGQTSSATVVIAQAGVSGTLATPFTVSQAIEYAKALGTTTAEQFYVKGIVSKIQGDFTEKYGNGSFWISDDGIYHDKDTSVDFEGYNVYWLDNQKWVEGTPQLSVGDEVIICGKLTVYNGLAETSSKEAYLYSVNGIKDGSEGVGSQAYPLTVKGAINFMKEFNGTTDLNYYVKGKASKIVYTFSANYGTGTFWLSDDGVYHDSDKSQDFEAYSVYWLGNQAWQDGFGQVEVGDEVVVCGKLTLYNGLAETSSKKAYVYSLNGNTESLPTTLR